jgi:hypothetical protein
MKMPTKAPATERPRTVDVLTQIAELAVSHRFQDRTPRLADVARLTSLASRVLRYDNIDEKISTENAVTLAIARKMALIT